MRALRSGGEGNADHDWTLTPGDLATGGIYTRDTWDTWNRPGTDLQVERESRGPARISAGGGAEA